MTQNRFLRATRPTPPGPVSGPVSVAGPVSGPVSSAGPGSGPVSVTGPVSVSGTVLVSTLTSGTASLSGPALPTPRLSSRRVRIAAFVRLGRPKFLMSSLLSFGLGTTVAAYHGGKFELRWYLLGQAFVSLVHLMTHYCNEYFDLTADLASQDTTGWTSGSRVLTDGILRPIVSLSTSFILLFFTLGLVLLMPSTEARAVALLAIGLAWFYTAPPFQFNYRGLGEFTVATVLNCLFPLVGALLQGGSIPSLLLLVCAPIMLVQHARMMIMNLSDYEGDSRVGKHTLAVFLGPNRTVQAFIAEQTLAYVLVGAFTLLGNIPFAAGALLLATSPLFMWQAGWLLRGGIEDPKRRARLVFGASIHVSLIHCAALGGLLLAGGGLAPAVALRVPTALLVAFFLFFAHQLLQNWARVGQASTPAGEPQTDATA